MTNTKIILNKVKRLILLSKTLMVELFRRATVVNASLTLGYDGKPLPCNWGDDINFWFFKEISKRPLVIYNQSVLHRLLPKKHILGIGSILGMLHNRKSIVWGSGFITGEIASIEPPADIRAVRGPLTRKKLIEMNIPCPEVYGDPAMLIAKHYHPEVEKKYKLGIISQYSERQRNAIRAAIAKEDGVTFIDINNYGHWHDFVNKILECEVIASTSLHGLIMSEAYEIPSVWIKLPINEAAHDFKYHDFYLSLGKKCEPVEINGTISVAELVNHARDWHPGNIDLQPLIDACPFKLNTSWKRI